MLGMFEIGRRTARGQSPRRPRAVLTPRHWAQAAADNPLARFVPFSSLVSPHDVITRGGDYLRGLSDALGFWTEKSMYGRSYMGMVRSTVLVGADGKVAQVWSPVKVKGHAAEVLAATQAL